MAKTNSHTVESILGDLKANKVAPVYFLQGSEPYYIDQISDYIEKNLLSEADKGFNQTIMYGKDVDLNTVITSAKRFPMMSERQVVIVKEAQDIKDLEKTVSNKISGKEIEFNPLENYIKSPLRSTVLVICFRNGMLDGRKSLAKSMEEHAVLFTSKGFADYQTSMLLQWIVGNVKARGKLITESAANLLIELIGNNLSRLDKELDKILINLDAKNQIDEAIVLQFTGVSKEYNIFELQKALATKDFTKCVKIIQYFSENQKDNPIQKNLGSLYGYFTKLFLVKTSQPKDDFEASRILGLPPMVAKEYLFAAKKYQDMKLINIFSHLREADMRSKGVGIGSIDDAAIMKDLVVKIMM